MSDSVIIIESDPSPKIIEVDTAPINLSVIEAADSKIVEISTNPLNIEVTIPTTPEVVQIVAVGPQGPAGPTGPQGAAGSGTFFRYDNSVPNGTWIVSHNLGRVPNVQVFSTLGELIYPDLVVTSSTITVTFAAATAGFLIAV